MSKKKELTHKEISSLGGQTTKAKYGAKHYKKMAEIRWNKKVGKKKK